MSANLFEQIKGGAASLGVTADKAPDLFRLANTLHDDKQGHSISDGIRRGVGKAATDLGHGDASNLPVFARELEYVYTTVYEQEFAELKMANGAVIPIDESVDNAAETFTYYTLSAAGIAKMGNTYAMGGIPRVSISGIKTTGNVAAILNCFGYSVQDMRAIARTGRNLDTMYATASRRGHEELWNRAGLWGDKSHKLHGLLTHPNVPKQYAPVGVGGDTKFSGKAFDEVFADFVALIEGVAERTYGKERVTHVFYPREVNRVLLTLRVPGQTTTLKQHLAENYPDVVFDVLDELGASHPLNPTGVGIMVALRQDRDAAALVIPQMYEMFEPRWFGLEWLTIAHSRIGGVKIPRPYSISIMAAIS